MRFIEIVSYDPIDVALDSLATMLDVTRKRVNGMLEDCHFHDRDADPFARGADRYVPVNGLKAQTALGRPIEDTLFFAGESTSRGGWNGTVDGAIESGGPAAREIVASLRTNGART